MLKLLWKEWHEQSWKLGFGCLVLAALAWIGLRSRIIADETMVEWVCFIGVTLLPILSSTGLVPAERSEGSLESLLAMPISPRKILAAKTVMGLLLCAGPMAVAAGVSLLAAGGREMTEGHMMIMYLRSALAGLSLFVWMMALTIGLPSEARAALVAVGLLMIWAMLTGAAAMPKGPIPWPVYAISPISFVYESQIDQVFLPPLAGGIAVQGVVMLLVWIWSSRQLTKSVEGRS
jgi:ABC-type transport system involved in multi-copper enzyme maturation permease subunit